MPLDLNTTITAFSDYFKVEPFGEAAKYAPVFYSETLGHEGVLHKSLGKGRP